ncbi:MAG: hypothetical protein K8E24_014305 [Methanobacterium paludis]|nr:hypothetical protein [Methanobacterium paludis]
MGVDIGKVTGTFELVSSGMVKGMNDIIKKLDELNKAQGKANDTEEKGKKPREETNKQLTESQKLYDKLTKSRVLDNKALTDGIKQTNLSSKSQSEFISQASKLRDGVNANEISMGKYNKAMSALADQYKLTYKNGGLFYNQMSEGAKLVKEQFLSSQLVTPDKIFASKDNTNYEAFVQKMNKANELVKANKMSIGEYKTNLGLVTKELGFVTKANGYAFDPTTMDKAKTAVNDYVKTYDSALLQMKRGIGLTDEHKQAVDRASISEQTLTEWKRQGRITQSDYNNVMDRSNGSLAKTVASTSNLTKSYGSLSNATNSLSRSQRMQNFAMQSAALRYNAVGTAVGTFAGLIGGMYVQNFALARTQSISMDQSMQQMFQTMKLGTGAFADFNKALDAYIAKAPKVNKYALGSTIAQVGKLNNLSLDQMKESIPVIADIQNMMTLNGRTNEDAMLAINDAFDGQFKRMQEIGVQGKKQLQALGYDGSAGSLIKALEALDKQKGWSDLTTNVSTASDAMQILGNSFDRILVPTINALTPLLVTVSVGIGNFITNIGRLNPVVSGLATVLTIVGGAFLYMKAQMWWARQVGSDFMAQMTGLDSGMQRVNSTMMASRDVSAMDGIELRNVSTNLAELEHNAQNTGRAWQSLSIDERAMMALHQQAGLEYKTLSTSTQAYVDTIQNFNNVTREEAMVQAFGKEAITANTVAKGVAVGQEEMSTLAIIQNSFATGLNSTGTAVNTVEKEANASATGLTAIANSLLSKSAKSAGVAVGFLNGILTLTNVALLAVVASAILIGWAFTTSNRQAVDSMKNFNDFLQNGTDEVNKLKTASENYKTQAKDLESTRNKMASEGKDTTDIEAQIAKAYDNSATMADKAKNAEDALKRGRELKEQADAQHLVSETDYNDTMLNKMKEKGLITQKEYNNQKDYNAIVTAGSEQTMTALGREQRIRDIGLKQNSQIMDGDHQYSKAFIENQKNGGKAVEDRVKAFDDLAKAKYKAETSDDWMTSISAWGEQGIARLKIGWIDTVMQFENFKITLRDGWNWLTGCWNNTVNAFMGTFNYLKGAVGNTWNWIVGAFNNSVGTIVGAFNYVKDGVVKFGQDVYTFLTPVGTAVINVWNAFMGFLGWIGNIGMGILNAFHEAFWTNDKWQGLIPGFTKLGEMIWTYLSNFFTWLPGATWNLLSAGWTWIINNLWTPISTFCANLPNNIWTYLVNGWSWISSQFTGTVIPAVMNFGSQIWSGLVNGLTAGWSYVVSGVTYIFTQLPGQIWSALSGAFSSVTGTIGGFLIGILGNADDILTGVINWVSGIDWWGIITGAFTSIASFISNYNPITLLTTLLFGSDAGAGMSDSIMGIFTWIGQDFLNGLNYLTAFLTPFFGWISGAFNNTWSAIVGATQWAWNLIQNYIISPLQNAWSIASGIVGNIRNSITGAWTTIMSWTNSAWNSVRSIIGSAINGVWNVVSPIVNQIKNAFYGMRDALVGASHAIFDQVGSWIGQLKSTLQGFWNFITNPLGGSAGSEEMEGKSTGTRTMYSMPTFYKSPTGIGSAFAGMKTQIEANVNQSLQSSPVPLPKRTNGYAGAPTLPSAPVSRCRDDNCYAGSWDFTSKWVDSIKNWVFSHWNMNILGNTLSLSNAINGQGNLGIFNALATKLISGTRYQYYTGDEKSDQQALADGSFNCYDGAQILTDLASALGLSAYIGHGAWDGTPHAWAVVNGQDFDTTAFQGGYGWKSPKVTGYAGYNPNSKSIPNTYSIKLDFKGANIYGIEDFEKRMNEVANKIFNSKFGTDGTIGF